MEHLRFLTASGGDWVIYLLLAFSVIAVAVIIERVAVVTRHSRYQAATLPSLWDRLDENGADESLLKNLRHDSIIYRIAKDLMDHASNGALTLERHLETQLEIERYNLEKRVTILSTLGNNAPFVGLLGTVLGVIRAFHDLGASAGQGPEVVMQGISEALVATAVGILVALPCVAAFNFIKRRIKEIIINADRFGKQLIAVIETRPTRAVR